MKPTKYTGVFRSSEGNEFELSVECFGFLEAFFLLTADAIRSARHYQLFSITAGNGDSVKVDGITKCTKLFIENSEILLTK